MIWDFRWDKQSTKLISLKLECLHTSWLDHSRFSHSQLFLSILVGYLPEFYWLKRIFLFCIHLERLLELRHIGAAALGVVRLAATLRRISFKKIEVMGRSLPFLQLLAAPIHTIH